MSNIEVTPDNADDVTGLLGYNWSEQHPAFVVKADKARLLKLTRNCDSCKVWVHGLGCEVIVQNGSIQAAIQAADDSAEYAVLFNGVDLVIGGRIYDSVPEERRDDPEA